MKRLYQIVCYLIALSAVNNSYAQSPKFRDLPPQNYRVSVPITPLTPIPRAGSGTVPANNYGEVTTFAGNGSEGAANGTGNLATFKGPLDIKQDAAGNFFVADADNNVIRKITPAGVVSTFAGDGTAGYQDGNGTAARFSHPIGMVFDPAGNLFVVDQGNQLIRKITPAGDVTVFAGVPGTVGLTNNTFNNPTGITIDAYGNFYITDTNNARIRQVPPTGGYVVPFAGGGTGNSASNINGPGVTAAFYGLAHLITGPEGNLYVVNAEIIRRVTPSAIVSTVAGVVHSYGPYDGDSKTAVFQRPYGITIDQANTMFIADMGNHLIRRFGRQEDFISKLAGTPETAGFIDGIGLKAAFNRPAGVTLDANGFLYVADAGNNAIRRVSTTGYQIFPELPPGLIFDGTTGIISGTPTAPSPAKDYTIIGYNTQGKGVYVVNIQVNVFTPQTQTITFGPLPPKKETDLDFPLVANSSNPNLPITFESSDISVASISDGKIHILGPGTVTITAYQKGDPNFADATPVSQTLVVSAVPIVYQYPTVTPKGNPVIIPVDETGKVTVTTDKVADIAIDATQPEAEIKLETSLYDCTSIGPQTVSITAGYGADPADPLSARFDHPTNLVYDQTTGNVYIADRGNYKIRKIGTDTRVTTLAGSGSPGRVDGQPKVSSFSRNLLSIATDADGNTYVCDVENALIRKITPAGVVSTFADDALRVFNDLDPMMAVAIAVDRAGFIYVSDGYRIYKVTHDGSSATVFAGSGLKYTGNNLENNTDGVGAAAAFNGITGLFFGPNGDLFVSSSALNDQNTIRKVTPAGVVSTIYYKSDPLLRFTRLVVNSQGDIFVASSEPKIYKITPAGQLTVFAGSTEVGAIGSADGTGQAARFSNPQGIAIDPSDNLYIADTDNHMIRKITPGGVVTTIAGSTTAGFLDNTSTSNKKTTDIPVIITSPITITSTYQPVTIPYLAVCPAVVPDYTATATAKSSCTTNIRFTQTPAAGTVLSDGQTVDVVLTANDDLSPYDKATVTFKVTASQLPSPAVIVTPALASACEGVAVTYTATVTNGGTAPTYNWLVNGVSVYTASAEFTSSTLKTGDKITCVVTNSDGCAPVQSAPSNEASITADPAVDAIFTVITSVAGPICPGSTIDFIVVASGTPVSSSGLSYQWQVNGVNAGQNSTSYTTNNLMNGDAVTCVVTVAATCAVSPIVTSDSYTAVVRTEDDCQIALPNTFTPNGDGINDRWEIPVLQNYPDCRVSVFNRYGALIFQSVGYSKPWDGNYQGRVLSAGTYYYIVDTKTGKKPLTGSVTIIR
ncbi:gliding motility-associated C-terminal domain-containing protein [Mucilaginibacter sp.]|uniref:NHL domain-containing protein n=1 Tax=Mucilaginibacter sp. TaxID=1882438 RepID=UPI0035BBFC9B